MRFLSPMLLWLLVPLVIAFAAYLKGARKRRPVAVGAALFAAIMGVAAAAGPQVSSMLPGARPVVMLVVDVSASMTATDVKPTRLAAAQQAANVFLDQLQSDWRVGVVSFSHAPKLEAAPTSDRDAVRKAIAGLEWWAGTAAGDAVLMALEEMQRSAGEIVLLSDGATTGGTPVPDAAKRAAALRVPVHTIAFGTPDGRSDGQPVPPDVPAMRQLATATGGTFSEATTADSVQAVYRALAATVGPAKVEWHDFRWLPLSAAVVLMFVACGLVLRRPQRLERVVHAEPSLPKS